MPSNQPNPGKETKHAPGKNQTGHEQQHGEKNRDAGHSGNRDKANPADRDRKSVREEQR